jgi:hypothetical protein
VRETSDFRRVDVFSVSGGVGKTLLAVRLAQIQAKRANAPVLLIDADIGGPCLGDLLESWASPPWDTTENLLHLICGRPEYLPERLLAGKLPVYRVREECPAEIDKRRPLIVTQPIRGEAALLFCPSHAHSTNPRIEPAVLHALLGHESSGGWIGYLINQVIRATDRLMAGRLGGVIVDHSPSLGALQTAALRECIDRRPDGDHGRDCRAIMVTTPRATDLAAARDLAARITAFGASASFGPSALPDLPDRISWIVNRIPPEASDWKESIKKRYPRSDGWLDRSLPVRSDPATAESHAEAILQSAGTAAMDADLAAVADRIFG